MQLSIANRLNQLPASSMHRKITAIVGVGLFFDIYDVFLAGTISSVLSKQFHVSKAVLPLLLGSSFLGMFIGAILLNTVADRFGRRRAYLVNLGLYSLFTLLGAFSVNVGMLIILRFLAGIGIGAQPPLSDTYLSEVLPPQVRGRYTAWAYTLSFVGVPLVGFLGRALAPHPGAWRWLFVIGGLGSLITWLFQRSLPESPRWLESVGRRDEAERWMAKLEADAGVSPASPAEAVEAVRVPVSVKTLFGRQYARRTSMLWLFQILQTLGYYGFGTLVPVVLAAKGFSVVTSLTFVAFSFLGYPIGSLLSLPLVERIQRKWLIVGAAFFMALFGVLFGFAVSSTLIIIFGFLYTLVSNVFSNAYHIFQAEIFPTPVRATAAGWGYSLSRLMSGVMPFVLLPVLHGSGSVAMFSVVAAAMIVIMLDIGILAPKTTGLDLEVVNRLPDQSTDVTPIQPTSSM